MDEQKLQEFLDRALVDLGGAVNAVLMSIGDELGLYKALAKGPQTSTELSRNTNTHERYIREWLNSQAAGGYVTFDNGKYSLSPEQKLCLANPAGPVDLPGATLLVQDLFHIRERALQNFRTGKGMEWGEHHPCLFCGTERFFRAGYNTHLLSSWIPALDGVEEKLKKGAKGADIGAVTAPAPFCLPKPSRNLNSLATTITDRLSKRQSNGPRKRVLVMHGSRLRKQQRFLAETSI
jgi:hypothetical protein